MRMFVVCGIALILLCASATETQAREGFFSRLFNRNSGGSSGAAVAPVASYGSSGGSTSGNSSGGSVSYSSSGASSGSVTRMRLRLVPVQVVPLSSPVYEATDCPNCK